MRIFKLAVDVSGYIEKLKEQGKIVGFVPTMGALHEGHLSLIRASKGDCDFTICSIFINPAQFNDPEDLDKYPRRTKSDIQDLEIEKVDALFLPEIEEIYPEEMNKDPEIDLMGLDMIMEGQHRPGHFKGVVQVMYRLLAIVSPHKLYMGQKDFQQHRLVSMMLEQLKYPIELVVCPIVRDRDGVAMSSRNDLLTKRLRQKARIIFQTLSWVKDKVNQNADLRKLEKMALARLRIPNVDPEYFQIIDGYSLKPIRHWMDSDFVVACTAVSAGGVRLIDNMLMKAPGNPGPVVFSQELQNGSS